ncbi:MAG: nucleotidyltransferase [Chloroflexi bacterium CG_4_9_14_3_um_filter_45_9]|nr:MAG: nucleotidyltransferase [Chloroflexi bacterium CG_4_9_14_3_um_filter_45_9]
MTKEEVKQILSGNKEILKKYKVKSIALFGSYVRNEQRQDSDIDLLVELEEPTYDNFIHLVFTLEELLKKEINLVPKGSLSPYIEPYVEKEAEWIETR